MSIDHKITKYQIKLQNNEKDIYREKLNKYIAMKMRGGHDENKPKPVDQSALQSYSFDNSLNDKQKLATIGYGAMDKNKPLEPVIFNRKMTKDDEIIIEILYTGICHSDWHFIVGEWEGEFPVVPGHEIIGKVKEIGSNVSKFKIGDAVMVGPTIDSCGKCQRCHELYEQYCINGSTEVYGSPARKPNDIKPTGEITYGGYSNNVIVREHFVHKLPDNLDIKRCAPLMCAGATTYSPLKQLGIGPGNIIGVAGIGGLGHMAVKLAKAMGAKVVAITHTKDKVDDIKNNLGADDVILSTDFQQMEKYKESLDAIIDTIPVSHDLNPYTQLLKFKGILWIVGVLHPMTIDPGSFFVYNTKMASSWLAGSGEIEEMLQFCSKHNIMPDVEMIDIKNINETRQKLLESAVKYRYVIDMKTLQ